MEQPTGSLGTYLHKGRKTLRMFHWDWVERFSHIHPIMPLLAWGPISGIFLYQAANSPDMTGRMVAAWGFFGFASWTLAEYLLHRFAFHYEASSYLGKRIHFIIHGVHHDDPNDPTRLVMPPSVSIAIGACFMPIFYYAWGPTYCLPYTFGFIWGYLAYDYVHYSTHHFTPRTAIGRYLKQSHMIHHYVDNTSRMGVSSPFWDFIFGTAGSVKAYRPAARAD